MPPQKDVILPVPSSSSTLTFVATSGDAVDDQLLSNCAKLFSENYGIWGNLAPPSLSRKRVKMNAARLRSQCLSVPQNTVLVTCFKDSTLLGHAFATVWKYDGGTIGWVTQLVVDSTVRRRYIATRLLQTLKDHELFQDVTAVGLVSSHPASVTALAKYSNVQVGKVDTNFILKNASKILASTPIDYLKDAKPCGSLFEENCTTGAVSCLFTKFYLDHREPLDALNVFKSNGRWCLGELPEGHEFLIIVPVADSRA